MSSTLTINGVDTAVKEAAEYIAAKEEGSYERVRMIDEDSTIIQQYIYDARSNIEELLKKYITSIGTVSSSGFELTVDMPSTWPSNKASYLADILKSYVVQYVLWKWLETVGEKDTQNYAARAEMYLDKAKLVVYMRNRPTSKAVSVEEGNFYSND